MQIPVYKCSAHYDNVMNTYSRWQMFCSLWQRYEYIFPLTSVLLIMTTLWIQIPVDKCSARYDNVMNTYSRWQVFCSLWQRYEYIFPVTTVLLTSCRAPFRVPVANCQVIVCSDVLKSRTLSSRTIRHCSWTTSSSSSSFSFSLCLFQASEFLFTYGSLRHLVGLLGRGISPAPRPLPTQDNTTQTNTDTHPCPEQDSTLRSQCSSGRRQYLP
jgi:hypothetical protein